MVPVGLLIVDGILEKGASQALSRDRSSRSVLHTIPLFQFSSSLLQAFLLLLFLVVLIIMSIPRAIPRNAGVVSCTAKRGGEKMRSRKRPLLDHDDVHCPLLTWQFSLSGGWGVGEGNLMLPSGWMKVTQGLHMLRRRL